MSSREGIQRQRRRTNTVPGRSRRAAGWFGLGLLALAGWMAKGAMMVVPGAKAAEGPARAGQRTALPPPEGVEFRRGVVYGKGGGRDLTLDLFVPKDARTRPPMPAMLLFHGGGWSGGGPQQFYRQSGSLAAAGILSASVSYRLSGEAKYPAALQDAKCAVRWMRAHAKELNVDPERIGCGGGSAGGHLAALLATTAGVKSLEGAGGWEGVSSRVCLAVLFNPVLDLRGLPGGADGGPAMVRQFLGAGPSEKPEIYAEASPITHAGRDTAPCLIFHGTADTTVPYAQAVRFRDALRKAEVPVELVSIEGQAHAFFNRSPYYEQTYAKMEAWLKERFRL